MILTFMVDQANLSGPNSPISAIIWDIRFPCLFTSCSFNISSLKAFSIEMIPSKTEKP